MTRVQIVFYSMYGHVHLLAEVVAEGARRVPGAEVSVFQVPELGNVDEITGGTPYGASTVAKRRQVAVGERTGHRALSGRARDGDRTAPCPSLGEPRQ